MSPAVKTPGTLVIQLASRHTLPRSVSLTPKFSSSPWRSGPRNPIASSTRSTSISNSVPGTSSNDILPSLRTSSTFEPWSFLTRPCSSPLKRCVDTEIHALAALFMRGRHAEDVRPLRPWVVGRARVRRSRQQLELMNRQRALAMDGAETIGAGIAAADNHDALPFRADEVGVGDSCPLPHACSTA